MSSKSKTECKRLIYTTRRTGRTNLGSFRRCRKFHLRATHANWPLRANGVSGTPNDERSDPGVIAQVK